MIPLLKKLLGTRNDRLLKQYRKVVQKINALEPAMKELSDEQLAAKTPEFKERLANGEKLNSILPEAFAVVREASSRVLGMRHFDVQMIGGIVLHHGRHQSPGVGLQPGRRTGMPGRGVWRKHADQRADQRRTAYYRRCL